MVEARTAVRGTAWAIYAFLVGEILFLISPLAPLFYSFYGPFLRFLEQHAGTVWLTQFFLPHISATVRHRWSLCVRSGHLRLLGLRLNLTTDLLVLSAPAPRDFATMRVFAASGPE